MILIASRIIHGPGFGLGPKNHSNRDMLILKNRN